MIKTLIQRWIVIIAVGPSLVLASVASAPAQGRPQSKRVIKAESAQKAAEDKKAQEQLDKKNQAQKQIDKKKQEAAAAAKKGSQAAGSSAATQAAAKTPAAANRLVDRVPTQALKGQTLKGGATTPSGGALGANSLKSRIGATLPDRALGKGGLLDPTKAAALIKDRKGMLNGELIPGTDNSNQSNSGVAAADSNADAKKRLRDLANENKNLPSLVETPQGDPLSHRVGQGTQDQPEKVRTRVDDQFQNLLDSYRRSQDRSGWSSSQVEDEKKKQAEFDKSVGGTGKPPAATEPPATEPAAPPPPAEPPAEKSWFDWDAFVETVVTTLLLEPVPSPPGFGEFVELAKPSTVQNGYDTIRAVKQNRDDQNAVKENPNPEGAGPIDPNTAKMLAQFKAALGKGPKSAAPTLGQMLSQPNPNAGRLPGRSQFPKQIKRNADWYTNPGSEGSGDGSAAQPNSASPVKVRNPFGDPLEEDKTSTPSGGPSKPSR